MAVVVALIPGAAGTAAAAVTVLNVQVAGIVEMSEMVPDESVVVAGAAAVGTVEVAEVVVGGTAEDAAAMVVGIAEDAEAFGHQLLCVKIG